MKNSIAIFVTALLAYIYSGHVKAIDDRDICPRATDFSMQFIKTTDPKELHKGAWSLLNNERMDDAQKLITLVVFHTIQEVSWSVANMKLETQEEVDKFWTSIHNRTIEECEYALNRVRFPDA